MIPLVRKAILALANEKNAGFMAKTVPNLRRETVIGAYTQPLRNLAKSLYGTPDADAFLRDTPHELFEENQLHAFLICCVKDFARCIEEIERFLPYIDNWATCDQLAPPVFRKYHAALLPYAVKWCGSTECFPVRFGIGMLMQHFLDGDFSPEYPALVANIRSDEYYVQMEQAWYFATALAKQPDAVLPYFTAHRLDETVQKMAVRKSIESRRIPPETKTLLRENSRREK